jgi:hypothetical protein
VAAAALFALALLARSNAVYAAPNATLPPGCGTAEELEHEVRQRLGRETALPPTSVEIAAEGQGYRLRMNVGAEQRELEDADCRELFRAAVVIAVAVTLSQSAQHPPRETDRTTTPNTTARATEPSASSASVRVSKRELAFALGAGFNVGLLPKPALELELQGKSVFYDRVGVALTARYVAARSDDDDAQGRGLTVSAAGGQLSGLYRPTGYLEAALGASLYRLAGEGRGSGARADTAWAAGPNAGLCFLPLPRGLLWLGFGGELHWNALRPRFEFSHFGPIFTASPLDFSLFLRVGPRFH